MCIEFRTGYDSIRSTSPHVHRFQSGIGFASLTVTSCASNPGRDTTPTAQLQLLCIHFRPRYRSNLLNYINPWDLTHLRGSSKGSPRELQENPKGTPRELQGNSEGTPKNYIVNVLKSWTDATTQKRVFFGIQ